MRSNPIFNHFYEKRFSPPTLKPPRSLTECSDMEGKKPHMDSKRGLTSHSFRTSLVRATSDVDRPAESNTIFQPLEMGSGHAMGCVVLHGMVERMQNTSTAGH